MPSFRFWAKHIPAGQDMEESAAAANFDHFDSFSQYWRLSSTQIHSRWKKYSDLTQAVLVCFRFKNKAGNSFWLLKDEWNLCKSLGHSQSKEQKPC